MVAQGDGGVGDGGLDLGAVADDAGGSEQALDVGVVVGGDGVGAEVVERPEASSTRLSFTRGAFTSTAPAAVVTFLGW
ncbi:hypothetical protein [Streptomyces mirabilis]|uniref:hypothetical protein n=1 Tax=Streptomyces mirabilis TaxID=68239 RepID=UPI0036EAEF5D